MMVADIIPLNTSIGTSESISPDQDDSSITQAETIDKTSKPTAPTKKKKSALKSCFKVLLVEQGTCSTDGDLTAELSQPRITTTGESVDFSGRTVTSTFQCYPEDDIKADDTSDDASSSMMKPRIGVMVCYNPKGL
jgi:hypothetical protein